MEEVHYRVVILNSIMQSYLWAVRIHLVARRTNWSNSSCNRFSEYRGSPCPTSGGREAIVSPQLRR